MLSFEREISALLPAEVAAPLIARERRQVVSLFSEVRLLAWLGAMLIATGAGIIVAKNLDRIGPLTVALAIGMVSSACYGIAARRRTQRTRVLDDAILLLGALLLSSDVGYIEHQWHLLGPDWPRHFLLLSVIHAVSAYFFSSATLLSLAITAFVSWMGIERGFGIVLGGSTQTAVRAFICAGVVGVGRVLNRRKAFERVFDHFAANLALWGGLILMEDLQWRVAGGVLVVALAALTIAHGFFKHQESFLLYGSVYAVIAVDILVITRLQETVMILLYLIVSTIAAIAGLFLMHHRFRKRVV